METFTGGVYDSVDDILASFKEMLKKDMRKYVDWFQTPRDEDWQRKNFVLDSILMSDYATECRYGGCAEEKYNLLNLFCAGIATVGDSLMVLDRLVYNEKRYRYAEFAEILKNDFSGHDDLRREILNYTKFGNDTDADQYTVMAANTFVDAVDSFELKDNFYAVGGFYSLERENSTCAALGATPDCRKSGTPFSENQSPTYGADKLGITALLNSVAKLPLSRTGAGGLNLMFSQRTRSEILKALVLSYFEIGGLHVGISVIDRDVLLDAMENPDRYKSLTVRLYGFSEYFVSLPKWQQIAILNRTEYSM
jgi:formate C-acetyltransferase